MKVSIQNKLLLSLLIVFICIFYFSFPVKAETKTMYYNWDVSNSYIALNDNEPYIRVTKQAVYKSQNIDLTNVNQLSFTGEDLYGWYVGDDRIQLINAQNGEAVASTSFPSSGALHTIRFNTGNLTGLYYIKIRTCVDLSKTPNVNYAVELSWIKAIGNDLSEYYTIWGQSDRIKLDPTLPSGQTFENFGSVYNARSIARSELIDFSKLEKLSFNLMGTSNSGGMNDTFDIVDTEGNVIVNIWSCPHVNYWTTNEGVQTIDLDSDKYKAARNIKGYIQVTSKTSATHGIYLCISPLYHKERYMTPSLSDSSLSTYNIKMLYTACCIYGYCLFWT